MSLSGLFSDLPAILARNVTEHGLQVEQSVLVDFWAREVGTQPRMELAQALVPLADLTQAWSGERRCGMLRGLHAVLTFDGQSNARGDPTASMSHRANKARRA